MKKFDVVMALEKVAEHRAAWTKAKRKFDENTHDVMKRLLHEAAALRMSDAEVAKASGLSRAKVRSLMRSVGLNPRDGKLLLAKTASEALQSNAELLGIDVNEMDLMSPLAYLPMGEDMKQRLIDARVARVTELPEEKDAQDIEHYSELARRYYDLLVELGFCTVCLDGSTMPCTECGAGL